MPGRLLVISTDKDMRRSLAFSLGAHGYSVSVREHAVAPDEDQFDCTIIDEVAARELGKAAGAFYRQHAPVVLLHYDSPDRDATLCLPKPLRGDDIVKAVASALSDADQSWLP